MGICFMLIGILIYFVPSIVASDRKHSKFTAILVLNIFLGWTFLGWVVALVWACIENNQTRN